MARETVERRLEEPKVQLLTDPELMGITWDFKAEKDGRKLKHKITFGYQKNERILKVLNLKDSEERKATILEETDLLEHALSDLPKNKFTNTILNELRTVIMEDYDNGGFRSPDLPDDFNSRALRLGLILDVPLG